MPKCLRLLTDYPRGYLVYAILVVFLVGCASTSASSSAVPPESTASVSDTTSLGAETRSEKPERAVCPPPMIASPELTHFTPLDARNMVAYSQDGFWLIDPNTRQTVQLHTGLDGDFTWSPDGRYIAFLSYMRLSPCPFSWVMIADLESGIIEPLVNQIEIYSQPVWSPDGKQLAFMDANARLFVLNIEDRSVRVFETDAFIPRAIDIYGNTVDWLPVAPKWIDEQYIAFLKRKSLGEVAGIVRFDIVSGEAETIVSDAVWPYNGFALTRDGQWLAYAPFGPGGDEPHELKILAEGQTSTLTLSKPSPDSRLQWAPNGLRLIGNSGMAGVTLIEVQGTSAEKVYLGPLGVLASEQAWAPDGKRFALLNENAQGQGVFIYDLTTRQLIYLGVETRPPHGLAWNPSGATR